MVLSGFKALGPAAVVLHRDGAMDARGHAGLGRRARREVCPAARRDAADDADRRAWPPQVATRPCAPIGIAGLARAAVARSRGRLTAAAATTRSRPMTSFSTPRGTKTDEEIANAREATRIAELGYKHLLDDRTPGHERGRACRRAQMAHEVARRRGQFPPALRRAAQPRGGALERAQAASRRHHPRRDHAELPRPARADLPHRRARRAPDALARKYELVVQAMDAGIAAAVPGVAMAEVCRAINVRAGGGRLRRILPSAAYPPARPRPRLRVGAAGRCRARQ